MKVAVLCPSAHPFQQYLTKWQKCPTNHYSVELYNDALDIRDRGDILFVVSFPQIVDLTIRKLFSCTLVLHASDLPEGRGWSPHVWDVISGRDRITVSLISAEDPVDTGAIWNQKTIDLKGYELFDEINHMVFQAEIDLMSWFCSHVGDVQPWPQDSEKKETYRRRRWPEDSQIDPTKSIEEQFNLLRVCDPDRYPAYFELCGKKFKLIIERYED